MNIFANEYGSSAMQGRFLRAWLFRYCDLLRTFPNGE